MANKYTPQEYSAYFASLRYAILEPNASVKVMVRSVLKEFGVPIGNVDYADSLKQLKTIIQTNHPNVVIASDEVPDINFADIVELHRTSVPRRINCAIVAISSNNSKANASTFAEEEVDIALIKPFSLIQAQDQFKAFFELAIKPSDFGNSLDDAVECLNLAKYDESIEKLNATEDKFGRRAWVTYLRGECYRRKNDYDSAIDNYRQTIDIAGCHFMSYSRLYDIYFEQKKYHEAHECARELLKNFPLNPLRLESLIRLDIATRSYENLFEYTKLPDLSDQGQAAKGLAAGLAIGAAAMIKFPVEQRNVELIRSFLEKSSQLGYDYPLILQSVVRSYIDLGEYQLADVLLNHVMIELKCTDNKSLELEATILFKLNVYGRALLKTLEIFKTSYFTENLYRIALQSSLRLNRKSEFIRELYQDGVSKFKSLKAFENVIRNLK